MVNSLSREKALKNHIRRISQKIEQLQTRQVRFTKFRPVLIIVGLILVYWFGWMSILIAAIFLIAESGYHKYFGNMIKKYELWLKIKKEQFARKTLDWETLPEPAPHKSDQNHPFENDLNITGERSLHHLLDLAISEDGSRRLRQWLLETSPDLNVIENKQLLVKEMAPMARFRDKLLMHFALTAQKRLKGEKLLRWLRSEIDLKYLPGILFISLALAVINDIFYLGATFGSFPNVWILTLPIYAGMYFFYLPRFYKLFEDIGLLEEELRKFRTILKYIESYPYGENARLKHLCQPFLQSPVLPSAMLRKLTSITFACGLRMNPAMTFLLNIAFPWDLLCVFLIKRARIRLKELFPVWLDRWAELEALAALANFSYLNPDYTFPELIEFPKKTPVFAAVQLGHPLIPVRCKVCNDFTMNQQGDIGLITGSNMAGKSTFLKTVGINLCLAFTGGSVNASSFRTILFRLFCSMQISDSILDGISYFYAEVKRLKALMEKLKDNDNTPVFWFIDEIYKGTNSRERFIGSRAYLRFLSSQPAVGLLATHDLELAGMADQIPAISNYHFRDEVKNGKMVFEYKLHKGPCPSTNALKIMKLEGLPVA